MAGITGLIPLIILFVVVGIGCFVGYSIYAWSSELADRGRQKLETKNMAFTKDGGLRVGVKELKDETYADRTQSVLVNVWNHASLPNYKSRLGWNSTQTAPPAGAGGAAAAAGPAPEVPRKSSKRSGASSRTTTAATSSSSAAAAASTLAPQRSTRRTASPVPGGWD